MRKLQHPHFALLGPHYEEIALLGPHYEEIPMQNYPIYHTQEPLA